MMSQERNPRDLFREWREFLDSATAAAISATGRAGLPRQLVDAMQRQVELAQELLERERGLQRDVVGRLIAPIDAAFDLLEGTGATLHRQAEALGAAGRALEETAALMQAQAELFERTIAALRQPADLARAATGLERPARRSDRQRTSKPDRQRTTKPKAKAPRARKRSAPGG
jgi:hypothetical protein